MSKKEIEKKNVLIQASVKENVWYPDSPEFVNFQDFRTGGNVQKSPKVTYTETWVWQYTIKLSFSAGQGFQGQTLNTSQ